MYPSSPSQPPRPQAITNAREIPGVTKRPTAPMRGMAPQLDTLKQQAATVIAQRQSPPPAMKPMSQQSTPAMSPPSTQAQKAPQPQMAPSGYAAAARSALERRTQTAPAVTADDSTARVEAARKIQAQLQAQQDARKAQENRAAANNGKNGLADSLVSGAFEALGDKSKQPPGMVWDSEFGHWTPDTTLPPGVKQGDPGTYYDPADGRVKYNPRGAVTQALATDTEKLIGGTYEDFLMSEEQKAAQVDELKKAAAMAQWQQGQAMAARGMGGSGVQAMGLGDIEGKLQGSIVDMNAADRAQAIEQFLQQRGQDLGAYAQDRAASASESNVDTSNQQWREQFDYQKEQDALANQAVSLNNYMGWTATDSISPAVYKASIGVDFNDPEQVKAFIETINVTKDADGVTTATIKSTPSAGGAGAPDWYNGSEWESMNDAQKEALSKAADSGADPLNGPVPDFAYYANPSAGDAGIPADSWWASLSDAEKASYWVDYFSHNIAGVTPDGKGKGGVA